MFTTKNAYDIIEKNKNKQWGDFVNQILITGDEVIREPVKKQKKVLPIDTIVSFFAISIIILGICMISGSVYAKEKINEVVELNTKPVVDINRNDDNNTVEINIKHIRGITQIAYRWNEEEETVIQGKNRRNVSETIPLIGGVNTLTVSITEENGQTVTYEKKYTVGNIPEIKLAAVSNGVQIISTSENIIDHILYSWDDGEKQRIEVRQKEYEGIINAPKGQHTLKLEVVDENNMKATKEQVVVGDTEPTLTVKPQYVDGKVAFVIDAQDDEKITKVEITHNGGTKEVIDVNDKTYHKDLILTEGEINTLIVTVTNVNGLTNTARKQFKNY